jgi:acyl transferase domain-containing protein/NAD(P)-dependent dehydrogenase (short-subunit alcohol dehydrogenase family)/NAD(P)H-dependent flavin oxidoreductase YrpB (nitropropane dioxygenase family)
MKLSEEAGIRCVTLSPAVGESLGVAVASVRSGGWGLLDTRRERLPLKLVTDIFERLVERTTGATGLPGLAMHWSDTRGLSVPKPSEEVKHVLLVQLPAGTPLEDCKELINCPGRVLLLQPESAPDLQSYVKHPLADTGRVSGWVVAGNEVTESDSDVSAFVAAQRALALTDQPVFIHGGLGPRATQALAAMGIAGAVLDDALVGMPEAPRFFKPQREQGVDGASQCAVVGYEGGNLEPVTPFQIDLAKRYLSTGRLVGAIQSGRVQPLTETGPLLDPFAPGSALAQSHGTRFPLVQGPMTRVSDVPAFAAAVAEAGALPMLALGLMSGEDSRSLFTATAALMGGRPWGIGVLAFAPRDIRDAQISEILSARPDYVIISGGRPDQAQEFENQAIRAYLHVPTAGLLERFLDAGSRRFVFEGRECGGHVGRFGSLQLWEQLGDVLLGQVSGSDAGDIHVLFAGGIHDRCSAAGAATLATPLAQRGICTGVLMGSAYLMTREAVDSGAVVAECQRVITECTETALLESRPGHVYRVAKTPMAEQFGHFRSRLISEGVSGDQLGDELDLFGLGRSRIATKGEQRDAQGHWRAVTEDIQRQEGMYMVGEAAACCHSVTSMNALHESVAMGSQDAAARFKEKQPVVSSPVTQRPPADIAVIGMAALVPGASHHDVFWRNILDRHSAIIEVPQDRWDWRLFYEEEGSAKDSALSKWGGFFPEIAFDPRRYGIPPKVMPHIGVPQLLSLEVARRALIDAGYEDGEFDRENTSVIVGSADGGGLLGDSLIARAHLNLIEPDSEAWDRLPEWSEDAFAGVLTNISAGRVANRFDLGGTNVTLDAACASGLMSVAMGVSELVDGTANMALAGAIDVGQVPFQFLGFSNTRALSPTGKLQPFGQGADGTVMGEAITFIVLKRLVDAERDGDRIYSVIKGIGTSSDGKGLGMTAPQPAGQMRALSRAYAQAGFEMSSIGLYEAHGTGTPVGDKAEAETLFTLLDRDAVQQSDCAVGSVKSLTGHTKNAAGMVGLIKASLALYHRTLPPHAGIDQPIDVFKRAESPAYLPHAARPWLSSSVCRRAGVSAFGFGGTNAHAVLEEYPAERSGRPAEYGAGQWTSELYLVAARDRSAAVATCRNLAELIRLKPDLNPRDLSYTLATDFDKQARRQSEQGVMLAIVAPSITDLGKDLESAALALTDDGPVSLPTNAYIVEGVSNSAKVACLFPGQGSQYPGMAGGPAVYFEEFRALLEIADVSSQSVLGEKISRFVFPPSLWSDQDQRSAADALKRTEIAQPALGVIEFAYFRLLQRLGLRSDMVAGHSYGEYPALASAGVLAVKDLFDLSVSRGQAMANCRRDDGDSGTMAAVFASADQLDSVLKQVPGLVLANDNGPEQVVVSGDASTVDQAIELLDQQGIRAVRLPVGGAFHSHLMKAAARPLSDAIQLTEISSPAIPVYANHDGAPYPTDPARIRSQLSEHLLRPVQFAEQIEQMYADGARVFVEVGPGRSLTGLTGQILQGRDHTAISVEGDIEGMQGFLLTVGKLAAHGFLDNVVALYRDRSPALVDLVDRTEEIDPNFCWYLNGAFCRRGDQTRGQYGTAPFLTADSAASSHSTIVDQEPVVKQEPDERVASAKPHAQAMNQNGRNSDDSAGLTEIYREYHETMRQFLAVQESVMSAFLGDGALTAGGNSLPGPDEISGELSRGISRVSDADPMVSRPASAVASAEETEIPDADVASAVADIPAAASPVTAEADTANVTAPAINMHQILTGLVSEITGYPEDMLNPDQDLEAELGVDSIKRVEVIESALKLLPDTASEELRRRIDELIRLKTIAQLAEQLQDAAGELREAADIPAAASPVTAEADTANVTAPAINMHQILTGLVSEITGYPEDMLNPDQDLEAELGVDSIKRVEVIESALKLLPDTASEELRRRIDELIRLKTIAQLAEQLQDAAGELREAADIPAAASPVTAEADGVDRGAANMSPDSDPVEFCPRYLIRGMPEELAASSVSRGTDVNTLTGLYLVTEDSSGIARKLVGLMRKAGSKIGLIARDSLSDEAKINEQISALRSQHGPVRGVVHLAGLGAFDMPSGLSMWREETAVQLKSLAVILTSCVADLRRPAHQRSRVISASTLGGDFGRGASPVSGLPVAGGAVGLLKSLRYECPEIAVRAVDFDHVDAQTTASRLLSELSVPAGHTEVGYVGGQRLAYRAIPGPLPSHTLVDGALPGPTWTVVVTGGARGITAQAVKRFACPGMTVLLLGMSPMPPDPEPEDVLRCDSPEALRAMFLAKGLQQGDSVTPAEIEQQVRGVVRGRQISQTIEELEHKGAKVEYHQVDVRNESAMERFFEFTNFRYGPIDALVHGAGLIEDAYLEHKDMASFNRVFDTKVDSAYLIERYLDPKSLKLLLLFSSTAGRFGNAGQGDYAAANETLNRFAWRWREKFPQARVISICWGPWAGAGMASERALEKFRTAGIIPISERSGTDFLVDEMQRGQKSDVEVIAGEGPWDTVPALSLDILFDLGLLMLGRGSKDGSAPKREDGLPD